VSASSQGGPSRVLVVGAAYLVQGLIAAVGMLLVVRLAQLGAPLESQGWVLASGAVPWVLKFGLALALDLGPSWPLRVRAGALALLQIGAAGCVLALAQAWAGPAGAPSSIASVALGWFVLNLFAAAQDVLVDALALDTLAERRAATATAMGVGVALGFNVLGLWVVGARVVSLGISPALRGPAWWISGLALVPLLLLWRPGRPTKARARALTEAGRQTPRSRARELASLLWIPPLFVALTFAANLTQAVGVEFLFNELRWDYLGYAALVVPVASIAAVLGALAAGPLLRGRDPSRAALLASAALGLTWIAFAAAEPLWSTPATIVTLSGFEGALQSAMIVALHAVALVAAARTPMPTTAFVLAMASLNLARVLAPLVAPHSLALGWAGLFGACGAMQWIASAGLWPLRTRASSVAPEAGTT
jgi:MFS transporter, PAT family, beta-lactamase induction signal transducer AmpG